MTAVAERRRRRRCRRSPTMRRERLGHRRRGRRRRGRRRAGRDAEEALAVASLRASARRAVDRVVAVAHDGERRSSRRRAARRRPRASSQLVDALRRRRRRSCRPACRPALGRRRSPSTTRSTVGARAVVELAPRRRCTDEEQHEGDAAGSSASRRGSRAAACAVGRLAGSVRASSGGVDLLEVAHPDDADVAAERGCALTPYSVSPRWNDQIRGPKPRKNSVTFMPGPLGGRRSGRARAGRP